MLKGHVVFLHTVPALAPLFTQLAAELLPPDTRVMHIADEIPLKMAIDQGRLTPFIHRRVIEHALAAETSGARSVQVTCSSISPCVDTCRPLVSIPVLKIDDAMVDRALTLGKRIGVVATLASTLEPTSQLVRQKAAEQGKECSVKAILCDGAFAALSGGDQATHDRIVRDAIVDLRGHSDVILLAQASMARVVESYSLNASPVPILTSPRLAVERLRAIMDGAGD